MPSATHPLTRRECEALLRSGDVGRIAVSTPQGPHIVVVRYLLDDALDGPAVVTRIGAYSLLGTYADGATLAFEVGGTDPAAGAVWSIVARGRGEVLPRPPVGLAAPAGGTWSPGPRSLFLRLRPVELSGRRLDAAA
jgi:hypothetical protein